MPSVSEADSLKVAMWRVYGQKCAYTGDDLAIEDLVLDHVVPRYLQRSPAERAEVLRLYELPPDFDLLGIGNLVPTSAAFNSRKSAKTDRDEVVDRCSPGVREYLLPEEREDLWSKSAYDLIKHGLACAHSHLDAVLHEQKKVEAEYKLRALLEGLPGGMIDPAWLHDYAAQEEAEFMDRSVEFPTLERCVLVRPHVYLSFNVPSFPDLEGWALLMFKNLKLRDCMVTFGSQSIPDQLLRGAGTGISVEDRGFLRAEKDGQFWIHLGNVSFWLSRDETEELCSVVDEFANLYLEAAHRIERELFRSRRLPWAQDGFRLLQVPHYVWAAILWFAREHDYDAGSSEWHIFDVRGGSFQFVCEHPNDQGKQIRAILHAERDLDDYIGTGSTADDVWICWSPRILAGWMGSEAHFRTGVIWNAETVTARVRDLIPHAVAWAFRKEQTQRPDDRSRLLHWLLSHWRSRQISVEAWSLASRAVERIWGGEDDFVVAADPFGTMEDLQGAVAKIQQFSSISRGANFSGDALVRVLGYLLWCVEFFDLPRDVQHYVGSNQRRRPSESLDGALRRRISEARRSPRADRHKLDLAARSLGSLLEDAAPRVERHKVLAKARDGLGPVVQELERLAYLERLARLPWHRES
jgi:hypothetical protein